jgi:hypothetical protein
MVAVALLEVLGPPLGYRIVYLLTAVPFFALVAFGVTSHWPFGPWWSIPASAAGLFGAFEYAWRALYDNGYTIFWLIPLLILGVAMCRTRVPAGDKQSALN